MLWHTVGLEIFVRIINSCDSHERKTISNIKMTIKIFGTSLGYFDIIKTAHIYFANIILPLDPQTILATKISGSTLFILL